MKTNLALHFFTVISKTLFVSKAWNLITIDEAQRIILCLYYLSVGACTNDVLIKHFQNDEILISSVLNSNYPTILINELI